MFTLWVWSLFLLPKLKLDWDDQWRCVQLLGCRFCEDRDCICLVHSIKHIALHMIGTSEFIQWMNEYNFWHLWRNFWWALSLLESYMVLVLWIPKQMFLITNTISRRMMDTFSPLMMRTKNWPHHWPFPLGDKSLWPVWHVDFLQCNFEVWACIPFLFCQALELGHGCLLTVQTIFTHWKQRLGPCPLVIA